MNLKHSIGHYLKILLSIDNNDISEPVKNLIKQEEFNGAVIANRFRIIFLVIASVPAITNARSTLIAGNTAGAMINYGALLVYFIMTLVHYFILQKQRECVSPVFSYLVILADYAIFTLILILWWRLESPDNFSYYLKNYTMLYYLFPIITTVFQFRIVLVFFSFSIFALLYGGFILYGLTLDLAMTSSWRDYLLGPYVMMSDIVTTKPAIYFCVALSIGYAIHRSIGMVKRIGYAEAQKASLSRYFSASVVKEITQNPEIISEGKRQCAAVLFCDIRDFTKMSERMDPSELVVFLSEFRDRMSEAVFRNGGMIDKFIGDAVMAVFGVPHQSEEHGQDCRNAITAAREMLDAVADINSSIVSDLPEIRIGIGIHYGELFAGNIGTGGRIEYTVIGDVVNTASRIESLCKEFHAELIVSEELIQNAGSIQGIEKLPPVKVKGKEHPISVYKFC